jgi:UDP-glucose 4-epimerase
MGSPDLLDKLFIDYSIDAVMHFAAYALVGESVENPSMYYLNNVVNTFELLNAMVRHGVKRFIFSSSAAVYGEPSQVPIKEDHPCDPTNPYGATKLHVERMLRDYDTAYGVKSVCLRYFNAAGAHASGEFGERHDPETHLIPLILKVATGERESISILGTDYPTPDGSCVRDYVHVNDLTQAHLLALESLLKGEGGAAYNLGNSKGYSVREVIEAARSVTGHSIPAVEKARRPGDPAVLVASSEKIKKELGWKPQFDSLETILKTAWTWHQKEAEKKREH